MQSHHVSVCWDGRRIQFLHNRDCYFGMWTLHQSWHHLTDDDDLHFVFIVVHRITTVANPQNIVHSYNCALQPSVYIVAIKKIPLPYYRWIMFAKIVVSDGDGMVHFKNITYYSMAMPCSDSPWEENIYVYLIAWSILIQLWQLPDMRLRSDVSSWRFKVVIVTALRFIL